MQRLEIKVKECSIITLYDVVAEALGYHPSAVAEYDCKEIRVSTDIMESVQNWYKQQYGDDYELTFGMQWLCYGPKEDKTLPEHTVEVFDKFLKLAEVLNV